jgi:hypothetical protein
MRTHPKIKAAVDELSKALADRGQLVDIGWKAYRTVMLARHAQSAEMEEQFRYAYFSGAQHLFASIMAVMDSDREPTARDLERMSKISDELEGFARELEGYIALHMKTAGNA